MVDKHRRWDSRNSSTTDVWLTPPELVKSLGLFTLDPCAPENAPWRHALLHYTEKHDGLKQPWVGRVFCNPPYGKMTEAFLRKCADHGNAIALIFARVDTRAFREQVWERADAVMFLDRRMTFANLDGVYGNKAGAPSCLVAYGENNVESLKNCSMGGAIINIRGGCTLV